MPPRTRNQTSLDTDPAPAEQSTHHHTPDGQELVPAPAGAEPTPLQQRSPLQAFLQQLTGGSPKQPSGETDLEAREQAAEKGRQLLEMALQEANTHKNRLHSEAEESKNTSSSL